MTDIMTRDISPPPSTRRKTSAITPPLATIPTHPPLSTPDADMMRIFSWNINGITPFLQKPITRFFQPVSAQSSPAIPPASIRESLKRHGWPAMLFLQEVRIASTDTETQGIVRNAVNSRLSSESSAAERGPRYEAHFTLPCDRHNARGKINGVCSIIREDLFKSHDAKVRTVDWDREGRVSVVELRDASMKLALFNIYAVKGSYKPHRDPETGVETGNRFDRKIVFQRLLMEECSRLKKSGWEVLLAGNMNVAPARIDAYPGLITFPVQHAIYRADFNDRFLGADGDDEFDGIDVFRKMHDNDRRYTYFPKMKEWKSSCSRLDYFIVGRSMWDKKLVHGTGILDSEAERGLGSHVPIWVDINLNSAFGEKKDEEAG